LKEKRPLIRLAQMTKSLHPRIEAFLDRFSVHDQALALESLLLLGVDTAQRNLEQGPTSLAALQALVAHKPAVHWDDDVVKHLNDQISSIQSQLLTLTPTPKAVKETGHKTTGVATSPTKPPTATLDRLVKSQTQPAPLKSKNGAIYPAWWGHIEHRSVKPVPLLHKQPNKIAVPPMTASAWTCTHS
jgi:hypothetical protein